MWDVGEELHPVSNRNFMYPSELPTIVCMTWKLCAGNKMRGKEQLCFWSWQKLLSCRNGRVRQDADKQDQLLMASCFHNGSRFQLYLNPNKIGKLLSLVIHHSGSSSQLPKAPPLLSAWINQTFAMSQSLRANKFRPSGNLPRYEGNSIPAQGMAVFLEKNGQEFKICSSPNEVLWQGMKSRAAGTM